MGVADFGRLLLGTIIYRPYVYLFLLCFLLFGLFHFGWKRTLQFLVIMYLLAFVSEYSSTRWGVPFGIYTYLDETRTRELWISNIPFWDSLSFVFLSYFSFVLAAAALFPRDLERGLQAWKTPFFGGLLMMLLDVVIDPLALRGDRWFLGRIYFYPHGGSYFGVTLSNFLGWFVLGVFSQWIFQKIGFWKPSRKLGSRFVWGVYGVYAGVFGFNLAMTAWIHEYYLLLASVSVALLTLGSVFFLINS
jgi:uncharacterized membrane protein